MIFLINIEWKSLSENIGLWFSCFKKVNKGQKQKWDKFIFHSIEGGFFSQQLEVGDRQLKKSKSSISASPLKRVSDFRGRVFRLFYKIKLYFHQYRILLVFNIADWNSDMGFTSIDSENISLYSPYIDWISMLVLSNSYFWRIKEFKEFWKVKITNSEIARIFWVSIMKGKY